MKVWPFLHTRTLNIDYNIIQIPEWMKDKHALLDAFRKIVSGAKNKAGIIEHAIEHEGKTYYMYVMREWAKQLHLEGDNNSTTLRDNVGREIAYTSGIISEQKLDAPPTKEQFSAVYDAVQGSYKNVFNERLKVTTQYKPDTIDWPPQLKQQKAPPPPPLPAVEVPPPPMEAPPPPASKGGGSGGNGVLSNHSAPTSATNSPNLKAEAGFWHENRTALFATVGAVALLGIGYAGWRWMKQRETQEKAASGQAR